MTFFEVTGRYARRVEVRLAMAVFAAVLALDIYLAVFSSPALAAAIAGAVFWLLVEYPIHRLFLHMPAPKPAWARNIHKRLHAGHHVDPARIDLLFLPEWVTFPAALGVGGGAWLVAGRMGLAFFTGFWATLLVYEWLHLAIHSVYGGRNSLYQWVRKGHLLHHYKNEHYWFGITNPLADYVFRTHPDKQAVETSKTARTLGIDS